MPVACVAYGCRNRYKPGQTIHYFRFPLANDDLNKKWIAAIRRKQFTPTKWSRLCSDHFIKENYQTRLGCSKLFLKENAVPSIFTSFPSYYQKTLKIPRKEPTVRNPIQINHSNLNAAGQAENVIPLVDNVVEILDEIVPTTKNKEVQTVTSYSYELFLKKKIKVLQQNLRRKEKKILKLEESMNDFKSKDSLRSDGEPVYKIENCFSGDSKTLENNANIEEAEDETISTFMPYIDSFDFIKDNILYYICGFIVKSVNKKIDCKSCANILLESESEHNYSHKYPHSILVDFKNRGGLVKSSKDVIAVVKFIENSLIQLTLNFSSLLPGLSSKVIIAVTNYVCSTNIFNDLICVNDSFLENHKLDLVTLICKQYLKIRLHCVTKLKTNSNLSKHRLLTKLIIFNYQ